MMRERIGLIFRLGLGAFLCGPRKESRNGKDTAYLASFLASFLVFC